jgi:hypothetical protein
MATISVELRRRNGESDLDIIPGNVAHFATILLLHKQPTVLLCAKCEQHLVLFQGQFALSSRIIIILCLYNGGVLGLCQREATSAPIQSTTQLWEKGHGGQSFRAKFGEYV